MLRRGLRGYAVATGRPRWTPSSAGFGTTWRVAASSTAACSKRTLNSRASAVPVWKVVTEGPHLLAEEHGGPGRLRPTPAHSCCRLGSSQRAFPRLQAGAHRRALAFLPAGAATVW